jgi:hypothetical protein
MSSSEVIQHEIKSHVNTLVGAIHSLIDEERFDSLMLVEIIGVLEIVKIEQMNRAKI